MTIGAPIHIRANHDVKLDLKVQPYGYRIKNGYFYYKVKINNKSTVGTRATIVIDIYDKKTGEKVKSIKKGFTNQGTAESVIFISNKINDLDIGKKEYEAKVSIYDSPGVDIDFNLFDYRGVNIENFDIK
jgi:hypothetical protein